MTQEYYHGGDENEQVVAQILQAPWVQPRSASYRHPTGVLDYMEASADSKTVERLHHG